VFFGVGVFLRIDRPRLEGRNPEPMQQQRSTSQRVRDAELAFQESLNIVTPARRTRLAQQPLEFGFLLSRQLGWLARGLLGGDRMEPSVSVGVDPSLYKAATAGRAGSDLWFGQPLQGQQHNAIPISLLGIAFRAHPLL
jgi:hypothetical protein